MQGAGPRDDGTAQTSRNDLGAKTMSGAVLLSFDDGANIDAWHSALPVLKEERIFAMFYVSDIPNIHTEQWDKLREIADAGHVIGHHGYKHRRAGEVFKRLDDPDRRDEERFTDFSKWFALEIEAASDVLAAHGFVAEHYSYPYGNRCEESDVALLRHFKTLRMGGRGVYLPSAVPRVYGALDFGKHPESEHCGHEPLLAQALCAGAVVSFYMHAPIESRLRSMAKTARSYDAPFLTREDVLSCPQ